MTTTPDGFDLQGLPAGAYAVAALGDECRDLMLRWFGVRRQDLMVGSLHEAELSDALREFARALDQARWSDLEAVKVVEAFLKRAAERQQVSASSLRRWILSHPNYAAAVLDCMSVTPPSELTILRLLSRAGSQKLVFLATWELTQRQVVVKKLLGAPDVAAKIVGRETQAHPLSMEHPNIIETHVLRNNSGESFLVEEHLPVILSDAWRAPGIEEASNLMFDVAIALVYLHESLRRVHGDIKPDNIGKRGRNYVLLDFGICRPVHEFTPEATATGSLRTRAPEVLDVGSYAGDPKKVDVWALGATVFNTLVGRFPLFQFDESPPRVSHPEERLQFERLLRERVQSMTAVDLRGVESEPMRRALECALAFNPEERGSARELVDLAKELLAPFIRSIDQLHQFSPLEELEQLRRHFPRQELVDLLPTNVRHDLASRLKQLQTYPAWTDERRTTIDELLRLVS